MRIRRSVTQFFSAMVLPALCIGACAYFGYYAIWGERGLTALNRTEARLAMRQDEMARLSGERERLQHRIQLLEPGSIDPDMVEEVARRQLLESAPGQVAVPRNAH